MKENKLEKVRGLSHNCGYNDQREYIMKTKEKLSVKDIAELAGTSVATVSRVLNQNGRFSRETEERVMKIVEAYGYQPNQLARGLRAKYTHIVGVLVPNLCQDFYASITMAVQRNLLEKGYMAVIGSSDENAENTKKFIGFLKSRKVDGLIYIGNSDLEGITDMPTVYIDRDPRDTMPDIKDKYAMIECDNIQGGYLAGKELAEKGCKNICLVSYPFKISTHRKRLEGFKKAMEEYQISFDDSHIFEIFDNEWDAGSKAMQKVLDTHPETDGIFFISDYLALSGLKYLNDHRIPVPAKMKIVGFDDIQSCLYTTPEMTTIRQPVDDMARISVEHLIAIILDEDVEQKRLRLPVALVQRSTT